MLSPWDENKFNKACTGLPPHWTKLTVFLSWCPVCISGNTKWSYCPPNWFSSVLIQGLVTWTNGSEQTSCICTDFLLPVSCSENSCVLDRGPLVDLVVFSNKGSRHILTFLPNISSSRQLILEQKYHISLPGNITPADGSHFVVIVSPSWVTWKIHRKT